MAHTIPPPPPAASKRTLPCVAAVTNMADDPPMLVKVEVYCGLPLSGKSYRTHRGAHMSPRPPPAPEHSSPFVPANIHAPIKKKNANIDMRQRFFNDASSILSNV